MWEQRQNQGLDKMQPVLEYTKAIIIYPHIPSSLYAFNSTEYFLQRKLIPL